MADNMVKRQAEIETGPPLKITDVVRKSSIRGKDIATQLGDMIDEALGGSDSDAGYVRSLQPKFMC